jgi:hypothetical protein
MWSFLSSLLVTFLLLSGVYTSKGYTWVVMIFVLLACVTACLLKRLEKKQLNKYRHISDQLHPRLW